VAARVLLTLAAVSAAWATLLTLGGGIDLHVAGRTITSNDPVRPLLLASLAFTAYALLSGSRTLQDRWTRWLDRFGDGRLALLIAVGTMVLGIVYSATAGIASDGYGYVSEADLWIRRNLFIPEPLIGTAPWPEPQWTFAPLGYRPVPWQGLWAYVPIYSSGLPMIMAVAKILGGQEFMYWVVPAFGGLLTWLTFGIGRRLGSPRAGLIACWLVATSPAVLLMLMQPMSDVPVAAAWTMAIFFAIRRTNRDAVFSGLASALAILIRPNLAALAGVLWLWWLLRTDSPATAPAGPVGPVAPVAPVGPAVPVAPVSWRDRLRTPLLYSVCTAPGILITAAVYQALFGSPLKSGYGDLSGFFAWQHVLPNARLYLGWFVESQGRLAVAGLVAVVLPIRFLWPWVANRRALWMILGCLSVLVAQYLAYLVFDGWLFLRFLLTCWPFVMLGIAAAALALARSPRPVVRLLVSAAILALGVQGLQHSRTTQVFQQWHGHRRSVDFAHVIARETPVASVIYTVGSSGTLRHYGGRTTLRTDILDAGWLDRSVDWLRSRGYPVYLVLEDWEVEPFKQRYRGQALADTLDERLTLVYASVHPYRLYDLTGIVRSAPRFFEIGDLHALRSALPDPHAFDAQLGGIVR
jgi:hypothetical protein